MNGAWWNFRRQREKSTCGEDRKRDGGSPSWLLSILPAGYRYVRNISPMSWLGSKPSERFLSEPSILPQTWVRVKNAQTSAGRRQAIRFYRGSDRIFWCLTSLKWGAKCPHSPVCSPSSLTHRSRVASSWLGCWWQFSFNQGLLKWNLVSYGAVIQPFRASGPKATGQSLLNGKVWVIIL